MSKVTLSLDEDCHGTYQPGLPAQLMWADGEARLAVEFLRMRRGSFCQNFEPACLSPFAQIPEVEVWTRIALDLSP